MNAMTMDLTTAGIAAVTGGRLVGGDVTVTGVGSDTRRLAPGELFVALKGPNFDGHDYIGTEGFAGAAALVSREIDAPVPQIVVPDTLIALQRLAAAWRRRMSASVVALTGSNGKTTVKEMVAAILGRQAPTLATHGNLNNEIGVPLTLLGLRPAHRYAVIEMGANHPHEIERLTAIAAPDVALVNNAGPAHLAGFGSVEGVARAKGEIYSGLGEGGTAIVNADDRFADYWRGLNAGRRVIGFGIETTDADYHGRLEADGTVVVTAPDGRATLRLSLPGRHNAMNALAACACAGALGIAVTDACEALSAMSPVKGRLTPRMGIHGVRIIDDTYNANPASVAAAIDVLAAMPGERWLVVGDMGELGPEAAALHYEIGARARAAGIDRLYAFGGLAASVADGYGAGALHFMRIEALIAALCTSLRVGVTLLVKGSRSMRMERVTDALVSGACPVGETNHAA